jgi:hypothetical protein
MGRYSSSTKRRHLRGPRIRGARDAEARKPARPAHCVPRPLSRARACILHAVNDTGGSPTIANPRRAGHRAELSVTGTKPQRSHQRPLCLRAPSRQRLADALGSLRQAAVRGSVAADRRDLSLRLTGELGDLVVTRAPGAVAPLVADYARLQISRVALGIRTFARCTSSPEPDPRQS